MTKFSLVIDKSQTYLDFQKLEKLESWGFGPDNVQYVSDFHKVGGSILFGDPPPSVMVVNDLNQLKALTATLEKADTEGVLVPALSYGLIILTTVARVSTKKLEALAVRVGGEVILAKENAKDKSNVAEKLLSESHIPTAVRKFIVDYAGDDYDSIIPAVKSLASLPANSQKRLTIEDMFVRMPQAPGSIPPWDIEAPLLAGNVEKTVETFRRITLHSHFLVVLSVLKNKINTAHKIGAVVQGERNPDLAEVSKSLSMSNNYPFKLSYQLVQRHGFETIQQVLMELLTVEANVKGGNPADGNVQMELALIKICMRFSR